MPLELSRPDSYFRRMKRILCLSVMLLSVAPLLRGQGSPSAAEIASRQEAEENYKTLHATVDDMVAAQAEQAKRLQSLAKDIAELRDQAGKPTGNFASQDDLKRLADAIQEIDKKREADKELILHEIAKLGKTIATTARTSVKPPVVKDDPTPASGTDPNQDVYTYVIKSGDTYSLIAKLYREKGINVSTEDIAKANPGVDPARLKVKQKISIPAPAAAK